MDVFFAWGIQSGNRGSGPPENHKNIGFLINAGPDPLKNYRATKPAFNIGLSLAVSTDGPMMAHL